MGDKRQQEAPQQDVHRVGNAQPGMTLKVCPTRPASGVQSASAQVIADATQPTDQHARASRTSAWNTRLARLNLIYSAGAASRSPTAAAARPAAIADSHRYVPARLPGWNSRDDGAATAAIESSNSRHRALRAPGRRAIGCNSSHHSAMNTASSRQLSHQAPAAAQTRKDGGRWPCRATESQPPATRRRESRTRTARCASRESAASRQPAA